MLTIRLLGTPGDGVVKRKLSPYSGLVACNS